MQKEQNVRNITLIKAKIKNYKKKMQKPHKKQKNEKKQKLEIIQKCIYYTKKDTQIPII